MRGSWRSFICTLSETHVSAALPKTQKARLSNIHSEEVNGILEVNGWINSFAMEPLKNF